MDVRTLQEELARFAAVRDWEQFHSPKNLSAALAVEAAELLEIFQWMTEEESRNLPSDGSRAEKVRHELADVQIFLLRLADRLGVDLEDAVKEKMALNEVRYPVELSKGNTKKYTDLRDSKCMD